MSCYHVTHNDIILPQRLQTVKSISQGRNKNHESVQ